MVGAAPRESFQFKTPEEEIAFLRKEIEKKEAGDSTLEEPVPQEEIAKEEVKAYQKQPSEKVLAPEHTLTKEETEKIILDLEPEEHDGKMGELLGIMREKGIKNTLTIVEKMANPHIEDDFHRFLIEYIKEGFDTPGLREKGPLWKVLHTTLFEVALPDERDEEARQKTLKELLSSMEQFYAGMLSVSGEGKDAQAHFTIELAVEDKSNEIILYAAVPNHKRDLFEKHLLSIFPNARVTEQKNDYNIFVEGGVSVGSEATLSRKPIFPIKTYEEFDHDPLNVILNTFSKIEKDGGGAAIQVVFHPAGSVHVSRYKQVLENIQKGMPIKEALKTPETLSGGYAKAVADLFKSTPQKKDNEPQTPPDPAIIENIQNKIASQIVRCNIRIAVSAGNKERAEDILSEIESAFNQLENTRGNKLTFTHLSGRKLSALLKDFSFRNYSEKSALPLNLKEMTTVIHFPAQGSASSPQLREAKAGSAPAPINLPQGGTLLGINRHRGVETKAYLTKEDRLRHFYTIGQTGTGKTTLLKNMILQDIKDGEGVCMIDPHGSDVMDVLGMIPEERAADVIYFDPAYIPRAMALNMLEYDPAYPEQKTFVVNELFSIFQKLYGAVPESMGPIFEQYFRNAALLVLEDPESGSTLLDISRVLAEESYREMKLSRAQNPVVKQFWTEVAAKAGGEQSLANIVPYITSKFDVFMANDIMRPIIAQEKSSFNFRNIMDERKILLVNLSKGRLGDINANLLGLILVGKILMAALSRADTGSANLPPFYLYIDEFQNITTDSIAVILSEARKYKLSLTIAHQFIAQLEEQTKNAVFGNVGSLAAFRVGSEDAEVLEKQFEPVFSANDLLNIDNYNAYARLLVNGRPEKPFNIGILPPGEGDPDVAERLKQHSYETYGRDRAEIESEIQEKYHNNPNALSE
tara:strand:+ start:6332 stop:9097 length:2766 start_codon:yes stop_codon:yes gene_type:complete